MPLVYVWTPLTKHGHMFTIMSSSFWGDVGHMALGTSFDHIIAIVNHSNTALSFIVTIYLAL